MYKCLSPGAIGVKISGYQGAIAAAKRHKFEGVEINPDDIATEMDERGVEFVRGRFEKDGIKPAAFGLFDWRNSAEVWKKGLENFSRQCEAARALGVTRTLTWIMPQSNERPFDQNFAFHVARLKPLARIADNFGIRVGLEFVGPKTLRDVGKYPFVHTLHGMMALAREVGPNAGLLLDCFHWYTAHNTVDDILSLRSCDVVYVHVNDAPKDIEADQQVDNVRALPGETGVIDIARFLKALRAIGYNGPVTAEPFKKELSSLPDDDARLSAVAKSLGVIFKQGGLEK